MTSENVVDTSVRFGALDGYELTGRIFRRIDIDRPKTAVVFNCGGGVRSTSYTRLARYIAGEGFPVLTYDYRGIGASRPANLRGFRASVEDWSEFDCGGAIAYLRSSYQTAELVAVAHSLGSLLVGGAPNVNEIARFVFIGAHTGYYKDYLARYRIPMALLWHGIMPALTRMVGYFPGRALHLGEDIPAGVALQWAARRSPELRPESADDIERGRALAERYSNVSGDALVFDISDDAFATAAGTRRLLATFPKVRATHVQVHPNDAGMQEIGHFGFFRRQAESLWPKLTTFLRNEPEPGQVAGNVQRTVLMRDRIRSLG